MSKLKTTYSCTECGALSPKWSGQCSDCESWNTLTEIVLTTAKESSNPRFRGFATLNETHVIDLAEVPMESEVRISTGISELDRVLGGGLVAGSVTLIGGDPGIGKSTVLLQTLSNISSKAEKKLGAKDRDGLEDVPQQLKSLYVTGEESLHQVKLRAHRLGTSVEGIRLLAETHVERILNIAAQEKPDVIVIDSIQTIYTEILQAAPGAVSQVRESAAQLTRFAKQTDTALFLVGHVTKEGAIAGPRVLEHMVDTVLYFESQSDSRFRIIRAIKNRFGAVNELGIFSMSDKGLREVQNPSAIFLSRTAKPAPGSVVMVTWEGSRPLLVEVQALVDESHLANPRRVTLGLDHNRLALALAVLHRHGGIQTYNQDVFVNVVGGVRVNETAADLPVLLSVLSSLKNKPFANDCIVFGEVGLAGEIRPVQSGQERLKEAAKHGFKKAIIPEANATKHHRLGIEVIPVSRLSEALQAFINCS